MSAPYPPAVPAGRGHAVAQVAEPLPRLVTTSWAVDVRGEQWRLDAACAETDPEAFFPEKGGSVREAKRICGGCLAREECLAYALANEEPFGVWGGLSQGERRRMRHELPAAS